MGVAIDEAKIALAADANYAPAYNLLGLVYMKLNETADARANFERALALAPNDGEFNNNYGWFLCTQGREQDGIRHLMNAVKNPLYTSPSRPYTNAGLCALRLKDDALAEDYLRKAVLADGGNSQALYLLADVSYRKDKLVEARRFINQVHRQIEPTAETVWLALRIERKLGDRDAEASYATRLNRDFAGSKEQRALARGQYD